MTTIVAAKSFIVQTPSLVCAGKAGSYQSGAIQDSTLMVGSQPCPKFLPWVTVNDSGIHSSLLDCDRNNAIKSFIVQAPEIKLEILS